jgi:hypothetical protein
MLSTTYGTGELILHAIEHGYREFIIGIGGSATNDAGLGMLQALGFRFYDQNGEILGKGGQILDQIVAIDFSSVHPALKDARFTIACDVRNPFSGPEGAAYVFARQKGADGAMIEKLDAGMKRFSRLIHSTTGREITEESVKKAVDKSKIASNNYYRQLHLRKGHDIASTLTNELYALFMCHLLAGTDESVRYTQLLRDDVRRAPAGDGFHVLWMHTMPFLQDAVKDVFNYSDTIHISASDFIADGFRSMESDDPYEALAEKMVYCIYNGSVNQRIEEAKELADTVGADGAVLFAHWGCKNTIGASSLIKRSLEREGLPTMVLDGDGCNPANASDGQISTRLQAFVEMLTEQERN